MRRSLIKLIILGIFLVLFAIPTAAEVSRGLVYPEYSQKISMDFQDANMKDVLKVFSQQSGLNFIASDEVKDRTVTLFLDNVPVEEALQRLLRANNLTFEIEEGSNIFIVKELPEIQKTITKIFFLKYASVSNSRIKSEIDSGLIRRAELGEGDTETTGASVAEPSEGVEVTSIRDIVESVLSDTGKVIEDPRTNSLIVTDIPEQFPIIEQTISRLDVPTPQVLIEVEMLDVSKDLVDKLGVNWYYSTTPWLTYSGPDRTTGFPFAKRLISEPLKSEVFNMGTLSFGGLDIALELITTDTNTRYLARPRILTLSNETAEIKIVTDEAIGTVTETFQEGAAASSATEAERAETGVSLRVTPQVNLETGEIIMFVEPTVSETKIGKTFGSTTYYDPERRQTKSVLRVKDGETIVIGGLIRNRLTEVITKVPILGDIPLLGALFRHRDKSKDEDRELMIFITPHIITDEKLTRATNNTRSSLPTIKREQDIPKTKKIAIEKALSKFEKISH
jgi:type IV pilus secretin PilQ/predicted competence protein